VIRHNASEPPVSNRGVPLSPPDTNDHVVPQRVVQVPVKLEIDDPVIVGPERYGGVGHTEYRSQSVHVFRDEPA
jgi:hypothetical protein